MTSIVSTVEVESISVTTDPYYSASRNLTSFGMHSWQFDYSNGTGVTATIQYSNNQSTWVTDTTMSVALSGSGTTFFNPQRNGAAYARMKFSGATGCTGTIYFNNKGRGH